MAASIHAQSAVIHFRGHNISGVHNTVQTAISHGYDLTGPAIETCSIDISILMPDDVMIDFTDMLAGAGTLTIEYAGQTFTTEATCYTYSVGPVQYPAPLFVQIDIGFTSLGGYTVQGDHIVHTKKPKPEPTHKPAEAEQPEPIEQPSKQHRAHWVRGVDT